MIAYAPEVYQISEGELRRAMAFFRELKLQQVCYSEDPLVTVRMGELTQQNAELSAGVETGIKLGLLIAQLRGLELPLTIPEILL